MFDNNNMCYIVLFAALCYLLHCVACYATWCYLPLRFFALFKQYNINNFGGARKNSPVH